MFLFPRPPPCRVQGRDLRFQGRVRILRLFLLPLQRLPPLAPLPSLLRQTPQTPRTRFFQPSTAPSRTALTLPTSTPNPPPISLTVPPTAIATPAVHRKPPRHSPRLRFQCQRTLCCGKQAQTPNPENHIDPSTSAVSNRPSRPPCTRRRRIRSRGARRSRVRVGIRRGGVTITCITRSRPILGSNPCVSLSISIRLIVNPTISSPTDATTGRRRTRTPIPALVPHSH